MQLVHPLPTDHENSRGDVPQEPQEGFGGKRTMHAISVEVSMHDMHAEITACNLTSHLGASACSLIQRHVAFRWYHCGRDGCDVKHEDTVLLL